MSIDFALPPGLEAHDPPEARGTARDGAGRRAHGGRDQSPQVHRPGQHAAAR
ncbi:MAG: hypothetical protein ACLPQY_05385 [Streptosporangiaceae bacterium]